MSRPSRHLSQDMDLDDPPISKTQVQHLSSSGYDFKPLPPTPPFRLENRWSHAGTSSTPLRGAMPPPPPHGPKSRSLWDDASSMYSQDSPTLGAASQRTLSFVAGGTDNAEETTRMPSIPPPRDPVGLGLMVLPYRSDTCLAQPQRPPAQCHFETLQAHGQHYDEFNITSSRGQYHATATQIASFTQLPPAADWEQKKPRRIFFSKENLSFASKVLQTGRKQPPCKVDTANPVPSSGKHPERTPYPDRPSDAPLPPGGRSRRTSTSSYTQAVAKVFRRSSRQQTTPEAAGKPQERGDRASGGSGWYSDEDDDVEERFIPTWSRRASGPDTPRPLTQRTGEQWHELMAHARRAASAVVMSKEERRRAALRAKIRVIPERGPSN